MIDENLDLTLKVLSVLIPILMIIIIYFLKDKIRGVKTESKLQNKDIVFDTILTNTTREVCALKDNQSKAIEAAHEAKIKAAIMYTKFEGMQDQIKNLQDSVKRLEEMGREIHGIRWERTSKNVSIRNGNHDEELR